MALKDNWKIDKLVKEKYLEKCRLFVEDDKAFANFRRDKDYGKILEGNEPLVGEIAYAYLEQHGGSNFINSYLERFKENDKIGNPEMYDLGISPATLRYINSAFEITKLVDGQNIKRIIEIGGGYGGLCRILSIVLDFKEYTNKDLPEAEELFKKYTSQFKLDDKINTTISGEYDLFIADSSLSECDEQTQLNYGEIATKCKFVYIVYNTLHKLGAKESYKRLLNLFKDFKKELIGPIDTQHGMQDFTNTITFKKI